MNKPWLLILLLGAAIRLTAQETTYNPNETGYTAKRGLLGTLAIIPFDEHMYLSDADATIGRETGLQPGELALKFRNALVQSLENELSKDWDIRLMHDDAMQQSGFGLDYVHSSVKYRYVPVSEEVLLVNDTTLEKKEVRKNQKGNKEKSGLREGQVVTVSDDAEKFMDLEVANDTLITFMNHQLNSEYYLFINEFDIRYDVTDPDKISSGGLSYKLKVHFSCLDRNGQPMLAGAATTSVNSGRSNIYEIIAAAIPVMTEKVSRMIRKKKLTINNYW